MLNYLLLSLLAILVLPGCKGNLDVKSGSLGPSIGQPTISMPTSNPFYSQGSNLNIQGLCQTDSRVILSGNQSAQVDCEASEYSFDLLASIDGTYTFSITQDVAGKISSPAVFVWNRKTSVSVPSITNPIGNPYSSSEAVLNITGGCENGATISLHLDGAGSVKCASSRFSINLPKFVDANYNIEVRQTDQAGNQASANFVWQKLSLNVIPANPQVAVNSDEVFSITGGTPPYNVQFTANPSGATYNAGIRTYTAGTTAGVTDVLRVTDNQGFTRNINVQVLADVPDHFEFPTVNGDNQSSYVGQSFSEPLVIKVADRFGNGVSNFPLVFQNTSGDVHLIGNLNRTTNASGLATVSVIQGYTANRSYVSVLPLTGLLPDLAGTGNAKARFLLLSQSRNSGSFDLNFQIGNSPDDAVVADFNNDGFSDVLVLNKGEPSVSVKLGQGNGLFASPPKINGLCNSPSSMSYGLFNSDANMDLIMTCTGSGSGQYSFLAGRGNGAFDPPQNTAVSSFENFPVSISTGRFNADAYLDTVIVSVAANVIAVRMGNSSGTFQAPAIYSTGQAPTKSVVGDFNNDSFDDIAVLNSTDNTMSVFINNGNGTFQTQDVYGTGSAPSDIEVGKINSDNFLDIIVTNNIDNTVSVFLNLQNDSFDLAIDTPTGLSPIAVKPTDLNADNIADLIIANIGDSTVSVLYGLNNGGFNVQQPIQTLINPINISTGDFNSDTLNDVLVVSSGESKFQVLPGQSNGRLGFVTSVASGPVKVISADLNADGILDKAVVSRSAGLISFYMGNGGGLFSANGNIVVGNSPTDVTFVDLDEDGILDIVTVLNGGNAIRVFIGQGSAVFTPGNSYGAGLQPTSLVHGDFNKDGHEDILATSSGQNRVYFYPGVGDGNFGASSFTSVGAQPTHITTGDFNEDFILDAAVVNQSDGTITTMLSNGSGGFLTSLSTVQSGPNGIVSGFLNSDGFLDLAVSNSLSSSVSILKGKGDGKFEPTLSFFAGSSPNGLVKGDFNSNGRLDLAVGNGTDQTLTLLFGSFTGDFSSNQTLPTGLSTNALLVDDVNNDEKLDITVLDDINAVMKIIVGQ